MYPSTSTVWARIKQQHKKIIMSGNKTSNSSIATIVAGLALASTLIVAGILLIDNSQRVYNKSVEYTDTVNKNEALLKYRSTLLPAYSAVKDGYAQALMYFSLAIGILLLALLFPRLQNISFGGISLTLRDLPAKMDNIARQVNALQSGSAGPGGSPTMAIASKKIPADRATARSENWEAVKTGEQVQLHVIVSPPSPNGNCRVTATVQAAGNHPRLEGLVRFNLAEDFANSNPVILSIDGKAELHLDKVFGPFVLSAETGGEKLSVDLKDAY
jgi:hypothetical protein